MVKKWAQKVELDEGSLTELGWPSGEAIARNVANGRVEYATAVRKLVFIANVSRKSNPALARKARAIIVQLRKRFGKDQK
jgi:hypothetical protein